MILISIASESLNYGLEVEENWKRAERILKNLEASWLRSLTRRRCVIHERKQMVMGREKAKVTVS
jgi:hypothetical protein